MKKALITGITGQDGSHLTEFLLEKGYEVHGVVRRSSTSNTSRIDHYKIHTHSADLTDPIAIREIVNSVRPEEVYNLAAQSHVKVSFEQPIYTVSVNAMGVINLLEAIRLSSMASKFYQASTSEMFGKVQEVPQKETTPFHPRSPYGCSKLYAYWQTRNYREAYGMFACNGILFNHEGERRSEAFVTRKITKAAARIKLGLQDELRLGNLEAKRDWGYAGDFVEAMWLMLQADKPDDYVVATGETHSIREFLDAAFGRLDLDWSKYVVVDPEFYRPAEVDLLVGDISKAREVLKWEPKITFAELAERMVDADYEREKAKAKT